jgi:hypothetical protein
MRHPGAPASGFFFFRRLLLAAFVAAFSLAVALSPAAFVF